MLEECWMKIYIVCTCRPICFIHHASHFILLFNVKSKMATDMLLPVILSEIVNSDDEKPHRGETRERISFLNLFSFCFFCILSLVCLLFLFPLFSISSAPSLYSSPLCPCNLGRRSEFSLLLCSFPLQVHDFFYCYYFAECFSIVESFEIQSSNIRNDVIRMKCWMKQRVDQSNMKSLLNEPENVG